MPSGSGEVVVMLIAALMVSVEEVVTGVGAGTAEFPASVTLTDTGELMADGVVGVPEMVQFCPLGPNVRPTAVMPLCEHVNEASRPPVAITVCVG